MRSITDHCDTTRTRQRSRLRRVVIPFVDSEILVDGNGDDCRMLDVRVRVAGDVRHGRVGEELHDHRNVVSDVGSKHHRSLNGYGEIILLNTSDYDQSNSYRRYIIAYFTMCIAELRGGCGSDRSCEGVCPKWRIWFSIASLATGSAISFKLTHPSYVR